MAHIRSTEQRISDVSAALQTHRDLWVATADRTGAPYLIPLSFLWNGTAVIISTPSESRTVRNLETNPRARLALGADLEDVILIDATAELIGQDQIAAGLADDFATKAEFEPRDLDDHYIYVRLTPHRVLAWRSEAELAGRTVMRSGTWLGG